MSNTPPHLRPRPISVTMLAAATATGQWTNMPAAEDFLLGGAKPVVRVDLSDYRECRLVAVMSTNAAASGAKLYAKYAATFSATVGDYSDLGTSSVEVAIDTSDAAIESEWTPLAAAARADVYITVTGDGGDGATDPRFGNVAIQFR